VVLLRRDGRLVAAAAMMRGRRLGIPVLTPLGLGVSDFTDVLLDDSCAEEAAGHLARELIRLGGWQVIDLPEVPRFSATARLMDAWPYQKRAVPASVCLDLAARPIHELIATLPKRTAHTRRSKQRKLQGRATIDEARRRGHAAGCRGYGHAIGGHKSPRHDCVPKDSSGVNAGR
jgi:hypothetical protein